jgi:endonuclease YncB( thermonuclease family)
MEALDYLNANACNFFSFEGTYFAKVIKCYDGDTIHCIFKYNGKFSIFKIRMHGYDSCEMRPRKNIVNRDLIIKKAHEAKEYLEELILGKNIILECTGQDKYGRLLGIVKLKPDDIKSINDIMIENGYGYAYDGGTKKTSDEQLSGLQSK